MLSPYFSVIIPAFNEEKYIGKTLESLKLQSFKDFEIIVGDSYSSDRTIQIAEEYGAKIVQTSKRSVGAGRNAAAKQAQGKILVFIDADTVAAENLLKEIKQRIESDPSISGGTCPILFDSENSTRQFPLAWLFGDILIRILIRIGFPHIYGICAFYQKKVFSRAGGFREDLALYEDHEFAQRVKGFGKLIFIKNTHAKTSTRRYKKWGIFKQTRIWGQVLLSRILTGHIPNLPYEKIR